MPVATRHTLPILRAIAAALLLLALLSSAVPFTVLSAAHSCSMPCCAEGGCTTGACGGALFKSKKKEEEKLCGSEQAHADARKHQQSKLHASARQLSLARGEKQANAVKARALGATCSSDCCALSNASTQSRRGREQALLPVAVASSKASFISLSTDSENPEKVSAAHLKRLRARAPPHTSIL